MTSSDVAQPRHGIGRVLAASMAGTTVEWYDFFLYGSAAALVFDKLFFPEYEPLVGVMLGFLTYAVGFLARPVGGVVFGHFGDRVGRKKLLMISLVLMGGATVAIGLLPTYNAIGVGAPILLVLLRLVQGFAIGGEWGGAVLLVSEHGSPERRGFWASWPQAGAPAGYLLATLVLAAMNGLLPEEAFLSWGWRVPFLLSAVLIVIGYWVRASVEDAPEFLAAKAAKEAARVGEEKEQAPALEALSRCPRQVAVCMAARVAENISYYVITAFVITYATKFDNTATGVVLGALAVGSAVHLVAIPLFGALSDIVGRKPVYLAGAVGTGVWVFVFFGMVATGSYVQIALAVVVGLVFHAAMYAPQAAFFAEQFPPEIRYSGTSIGYQVTSIVAGAPAPLIATALLYTYDSSLPIALYVLVASVITVVGVALSAETRSRQFARTV